VNRPVAGLVAFACFAVMCLSACADQAPTAAASIDVIDYARSHGRLGRFFDAVEQADLQGILDSRHTYTIFAPTDAAFATLDPGDISKVTLHRLIKRHIVPGRVTFNDLVGEAQTLRTLEGGWIDVRGIGGLKVDQARVLEADLVIGRTTIHVIDQVLTGREK
jgi:uncharacterized surface protein with fasciclin (FAS1) repeats